MPRPDILTYRYQGTMVYVTPAETYQQGIQYVQDVFPALASVEPERIAICVNGLIANQRKPIRISPMAWSTVIPTLARFEVLDVFVKLPEIVVDDSNGVDPDSLPNYEDVKEKSGDVNFLAPSRGPSPYIKNVPLPELRAASRSPRPRSRSPSPVSPSSNNSIMSDLAKALFGKRAN